MRILVDIGIGGRLGSRERRLNSRRRKRMIVRMAMVVDMDNGKEEYVDSKVYNVIMHKGYLQGRAEGYSKAENDYFKKNEEILKQQFDNGENYGYKKGRAEAMEILKSKLPDCDKIEIERLICLIDEVANGN